MPVIEIPPIEEVKSKAIDEFVRKFETEPQVVALAPGRVNIIGGHVDYNDGFVLPIAIPLVTVVVGSLSANGESCVVTLSGDVDAPHIITTNSLSDWFVPGNPRWANYVKGILVNFAECAQPFNVVIATSVPLGAGLSSSAALEVASFLLFEKLFTTVDDNLLRKAKLCQAAEHKFAGTPCGIMDQIVSLSGKENHAVLIDCQSCTFEPIPFPAEDFVVMVVNSNVKHELATSEYSTRRAQCREALEVMGAESFRGVDRLEGLADCPLLMKRARHVVSETKRCLEAVGALSSGDLARLGELLCGSHLSLRDDYEVSCVELDRLEDIICSCGGVYGARMTGGGFGGSVVAIVRTDAVGVVVDSVETHYEGKASIMVVRPWSGAGLA